MKPLVLSGIVVVALAGYLGYDKVYVPTQRTLRQLHNQLAEQQKAQALRGALAQLLKELEGFQQRLAPKLETEWVIRQINQAVEKSGVRPPTSILPKPISKLQDFTVLAVTVRLDASYHELGRLMSALERAGSFLQIDEFQISRELSSFPQAMLTVSTLYVPPLTHEMGPRAERETGAPSLPWSVPIPPRDAGERKPAL